MFPRLYAILDLDVCHARRLDPRAVFTIWVSAGIRLIQLRAKDRDAGPMLTLATSCAREARDAGVTFIVNDRADVARLSGADGVHVGQGDLAPADARRLLPPPAWVGLSTHTDAQVDAGCREPVDYLAIGPVFAYRSKARPDPVVGLEGVRRAVAIAGPRPVVAIGGITLDRVSEVLSAGASSVAVISDLLLGDPEERARQFVQTTASTPR